jgi:hypothetical protein
MPTLSNPKHEQFAQWIVAGKTQIEAYELCYGNRSKGANSNASKLKDKPNISARIIELRTVIIGHLPVLTLEKKRGYLLKAVETPIGQIDETSPLCQSYKVTTRTDRDGTKIEEKHFESVNKLKALEIDAKLAGEFIHGPTQFNVNIYGGEKIIDAIEIEAGAPMSEGL